MGRLSEEDKASTQVLDSSPENMGSHLPWNVNLQEFPPGTHSSNPHCHSHEDEFALVLSGSARYWYQGEVPEKILKRGDCVGWKAGTGISHSLLNDAEGPNGEGK
jgi:uncharacterized cupin superfamily protein